MEPSVIGDQQADLADAIQMYPKLKCLYRTSDNTIHTLPEDARAQALHLSDGTIEQITCKTGKITILNSLRLS